MRLAYDLGLHLDMTPYMEKGIISTEECKIRRTIFWVVYLNEQYVCLCSFLIVNFCLLLKVLGLLPGPLCS